MSPPRPSRSETPASTVGRVGRLSLRYGFRERQTVLLHSSSRTPWHLFPPISLDDTGCAYTYLVNPSGGLVGGDRLSIDAVLEADAHVVVATPSATRVYRSTGQVAEQTVALKVGKAARLEWVPDILIPYKDSRFRQILHVELEEGAALLLWDAIAAGRIARQERWAFASLENEIRITAPSGGAVVERYGVNRLHGDGVGLLEDWDYVGSFYVVGEAVPEEGWKRLGESMVRILGDRQGRVLGGVSEPAVRGLVLKVVAKSAPDLNATFESIWATARALLWGLPFPALRRY